MNKLVIKLCITLLCWGCGEPSVHDESQSGWEPSAKTGIDLKTDTVTEGGRCVITMCLTGAMNHETPSNQHFSALCADGRLEGLVQDCDHSGCRHTFDSFLQFPRLTVYPALLDALDRNRDGQIDGDDASCEVNLIGFSWGGVNILSIADHLRHDDRVPETHKGIHRAVLLDAFQPFSQERMRVPENIDRVLSIRHSQAPRHDCSSRAPLGPYLGLAPSCHGDTECDDYDYSHAPYNWFEGADGIDVRGQDIGHCGVPYVAHEAVIDFVHDRDYAHRLPSRQ